MEINLVTYELNTRNGLKITTAGFARESIITGGGLKVIPDIILSKIKVENTALLILPSGEMWNNFKYRI